jgi:hypothetical protein
VTASHDAPFAATATPDAIRAQLDKNHSARRRVDRRIAWLERLLKQRTAQIAAGTWPETSAGLPDGGEQL